MKISVAMCTYNGARFLSLQLESIAEQTRRPDELVVCDDHSRDDTCHIVNSFASSAPFPVRLFVNEQNLGSTKNFAQAIGFCEGDIIALADQDDVWLPEKLRRIERRFLDGPDVGLVFSDAEVVNEQLLPLGYHLWESIGFDKRHRRLIDTGRALDILLAGWTVTGATTAFRNRFKNLVLDIPANLPLIHDGWIALMIASVAQVGSIEEPLILYRQHDRQQIGAREKRPTDASSAGPLAIMRAFRRENSYDDMIAIGEHALQRLDDRSDVYETSEALRRLEDRLKHLRARAGLPTGKLRRLHRVLEELLSRRYHRYANGFRSAAKDLLA